MIVEKNFFIGLRDVDKNKNLKSTSLLSFLEDLGGIHSSLIGYGLNNIEKTKKTWLLLSWKVKILKKPKYADTITVKTWSSGIKKFYAYRDFEVCNEKGEILCIATSKWIFMDITKGKIIKISDEIAKSYKEENKRVFNENECFEIEEPNNYILCKEYNINRNMIDFNYHVHNIYYLDLALEALPEEKYLNLDLNNFNIIYKREIKLNDKIKMYYSENEFSYIITIKSEDNKTLHAIIELEKNNNK